MIEQSILKSTKKILNLSPDYTAFDLDVITSINSAFSSLSQLGIGPATGFSIEDDTAAWTDFTIPQNQLNMVKTYVYLKVRMIFDPPATSFHIEAMNKQIAEHEWRLTVARDEEVANSA